MLAKILTLHMVELLLISYMVRVENFSFLFQKNPDIY